MKEISEANRRSHEEIGINVLSALSRLDSEALREWLDDDVVLELPFAPIELGPRTIRGLDNVVKTMSRARTVYESLLFTVLEKYPVPASNTMIFRAKKRRSFQKRLNLRKRDMQVSSFRDEKVIHWIEFFDAIAAQVAFARLK